MENLWTDDSSQDFDRRVEQLVLTEQFRAWVLNPTPESEAYWTHYQFLHPEQVEIIQQARALIIALQVPDYSLSKEAVSDRTERLRQRIHKQQITPEHGILRPLYKSLWRWAAAAVLTLALGWWGYTELADRRVEVAVRSVVKQPRLPNHVTGNVREEITRDIKRQVILPDGSIVQLAPYSYLRYVLPFGKTDRSIALTGQAFFTVKPNPDKPFLVFTDAVVTRVLGTSFMVQNRAGQPATVTVRTGRVSVYNRRTFDNGSTTIAPGLVLTPNQQATFQEEDGSLVRSLVEKPLPLPTDIGNVLDFENRPVAEVIDAIAKMYGVPIQYDQERLRRCKVTVSLEKEPLFDQLRLLNKLIDGHYVVVDTTIRLYANGCK